MDKTKTKTDVLTDTDIIDCPLCTKYPKLNKETIEAIEDAMYNRDMTKYKSFEEWKKALYEY